MNRRHVLALGAAATLPRAAGASQTMGLDASWRYVADTVMGGVSQGRMMRERISGRMGARLTGTVSTDNNGGFIQVATDLRGGAALDATGWSGLALDVIGNGETYELRLRTADLTRPWQSYRAAFEAPRSWATLRVAFDQLEANRTDAPLDLTRLTRVGVLAVGREFEADVAVANLRLWK